MHDAEEMPVPLDFDGPGAPVHGALEGEQVADLNVELAVLLGPAVGFHELKEEVVNFFAAEEVNVRAREGRLDEKLQRRGAEDIHLYARPRWQRAGELIKAPPGGGLPRDMVGLKKHREPGQ